MFEMEKRSAASKAAALLAKLRAESMTPEERQESARKGGLAGGKARANSLTKGRRKEIAAAAALARWGPKKAGKKKEKDK